jgi:hypothetical protein
MIIQYLFVVYARERCVVALAQKWGSDKARGYILPTSLMYVDHNIVDRLRLLV